MIFSSRITRALTLFGALLALQCTPPVEAPLESLAATLVAPAGQEKTISTTPLHEADRGDGWRVVPLERIPTAGTCTGACVQGLNSDDNNYQEWLSCTGSTTSTDYANPTDLVFTVADNASVTEAELAIDWWGQASSTAELTCLDPANQVVGMIAPSLSTGAVPIVSSFELPATCLANADKTVRVRLRRTGSSCFRVDAVRLSVRSSARKVSIAKTSGNGSCPGCLSALNKNDGAYVKWLACSSTNANSTTELGTPTDLHFSVPDYSQITSATFEIDLYASGAPAPFSVTCVNPQGQTLATLFAGEVSTTPHVSLWTVPSACFASADVTLRLVRTGNLCLAVDYAQLQVVSQLRPVSFASIPTASSCAAAPGGCAAVEADLRQHDDSFVRWIACTAGNNTQTEYANPTDFAFTVPDAASVSSAALGFAAYGNGAATFLRISCVGPTGVTLAEIDTSHDVGGTALPASPADYAFPVPTACFGAGKSAKIRFTRTGNTCIALDYLRLFTRSAVPLTREPNPDPIEGYAEPLAADPGGSIQFKVHSPNGNFDVDFLRLGIDNTAAASPVLLSLVNVAGAAQHPPVAAYRAGAQWATTWTQTVPSTWKAGIYSARLKDRTTGATYDTQFVVRGAPGSSGRVVIASTNTWAAYNSWGGASFYSYNQGDTTQRGVRGNHLSHARRPLSPSPLVQVGAHLAGAERYVLGWLDREGYSYRMITDEDLHQTPGVLAPFRTVIINTHSEYWSRQMRDALDAHLAGAQKNLVYLSGNGLYWKVTLQNGQVEVRKNKTLHAQTGETGGLWRDLGRPEAAVLGVAYNAAGYPTCSAYSTDLPNHFLFAGTGLTAGAPFGASGRNTLAACPTGGASGWEMDRIVPGVSPQSLQRLAHGTLQGGAVGAEMTYLTTPAGGGVFSVGSITFGGSLVDDPKLNVLMKNVLNTFGP